MPGQSGLNLRLPDRGRANMAHIRQSRPCASLGFKFQVLKAFEVVPSSLGSGIQARNLKPTWAQAGEGHTAQLVQLMGVLHQVSTLNPNPETLNPNPEQLIPRTETLNPEQYTLTP